MKAPRKAPGDVFGEVLREHEQMRTLLWGVVRGGNASMRAARREVAKHAPTWLRDVRVVLKEKP